MTVCMRYLVSGKVQGVFYRASARHQALSLGVNGYAKNLADGRVEVLACGERDVLARLHAWLLKGPPASRVSGVSTEPVDDYAPSGFTTG
ncbi:MAG: acylphosphatase [Candidatus Sedimenticola endophacoides]